MKYLSIENARFPHDRIITVIRADRTEYKTLESDHMLRFQDCNESDVRVSQLFRATSS